MFDPYPTMPMSMGQSLSALDEALKNAKCCLTCCDMKCGMPWLYACAIGFALIISISLLIIFLLGGFHSFSCLFLDAWR